MNAFRRKQDTALVISGKSLEVCLEYYEHEFIELARKRKKMFLQPQFHHPKTLITTSTKRDLRKSPVITKSPFINIRPCYNCKHCPKVTKMGVLYKYKYDLFCETKIYLSLMLLDTNEQTNIDYFWKHSNIYSFLPVRFTK